MKMLIFNKILFKIHIKSFVTIRLDPYFVVRKQVQVVKLSVFHFKSKMTKDICEKIENDGE